MAKSSIHFERGDFNFSEKHNSRESEPSYLLDQKDRKQNEFVKLADAQELYNEQMNIRRANHSRGRAPTAKDVYWEAVVNLDERHTLTDVKKVAEHLQSKYGLIPTSLAIHRDEGYRDSKSQEVKYNYHAHITFFTMQDGKSVMRTMTSSKLSKMQSEVADILLMERGQKNSSAERLSSKQYRSVQHQQERKNAELEQIKKQLQEEQAKNLTLTEQKKQIEAERKRYKEENNHIAEEYRKLQALNKTLHTQEELDKSIKLLRLEYEKRIQTLIDEHEQQIQDIYKVPDKIFTKEDLKKSHWWSLNSKDVVLDHLNEKIAPIAEKATKYEAQNQTINHLNYENRELRDKIRTLESDQSLSINLYEEGIPLKVLPKVKEKLLVMTRTIRDKIQEQTRQQEQEQQAIRQRSHSRGFSR